MVVCTHVMGGWIKLYLVAGGVSVKVFEQRITSRKLNCQDILKGEETVG